MPKKTVRKRLKEYAKRKLEIIQLENQIAEMETVLYGVSNTVSSVFRYKKNTKDFSYRIDNIIDLKNLYANKLQQLMAMQKEIEKNIECLPEIQRVFVRARYIENRSCSEIAKQYFYSERHVYKKIKEALDFLEV